MPEDLRSILELTSPRVLSLRTGWHQRQGLDDDTVRRGIALLETELAGRRALTRSDIGRLAERAALPASGQPLGDLLLFAELRGVVCSGPMRGAQHTYVLVDEVVPPAPSVPRDEALGELARRFFAGHGPASVRDLARWATLTQADVKRGADVAWPWLERVQVQGVDGTDLWFDPAGARGSARFRTERAAYLLPVYDEVTQLPCAVLSRAQGPPDGGPAGPVAGQHRR